MADENLLTRAKPLVAQFIARHFPEEGQYFEILWAALGDRLAAMDIPQAGTRGHRLNLGGLSFAGEGAVPVQKSLEVISILANAIPAFDNVRSEKGVVRNYIAGKAQLLRSERTVLDALADLLFEMLDSGHAPSARLRIDFLPQCVTTKSPGSGETKRHGHSNPWRLLEYLCCRMGKDVHWVCGFEIFPEWRKDKGRPGRQSFAEHRSRLSALLRDTSPDHWPLAEMKFGEGPFTQLEQCRFESNIFDAKVMLREAMVLLHDKKLVEAAGKAQEALGIWEAHHEAFQLFLACLGNLDLGKLSEDILRHVLKRVSSRAAVLRGALGLAEHLDYDSLQGADGLLGAWHAEMSQLVRSKKQLADHLKVGTEVPAEYTPAHALIDSIERLRSTTDTQLRNRLWRDITGSEIYQAAKKRSMARLRGREEYERHKRDLPQEQDFIFYEHVSGESGLASVDPRKIEVYLADIMTYAVITQWVFIEHNVNASDQRALRDLWNARKKLSGIEGVRPSVEALATVMRCTEPRVRALLNLERLFNFVDYPEEDLPEADSSSPEKA
jgi:hypothetical protein